MADTKADIIKNAMLKKDKASLSLDEILDLLESNEQLKYALHCEYMHEMHRQDVINEIDYLNSERENKIQIDDVLIDELTEDYEDRLEDTDNWHFCLNETFYKFEIGD